MKNKERSKINRMFLAPLFCGFFGVTVISAAAVAADYDISTDFSPTSNPSGSWSYGAKTNLSGDFVPYEIKGTTAISGVPIEYWQLVAAQEPTIYRNGTAATASFGSSLNIPPGTVWMFGGINSSPFAYGTIRFTVPTGESGTYIVETDVAPAYDGGPQGDTDYHVVKNGAELFGQFLAPIERTGYTNALALAGGDVLDFMIGRGADNNNYGSGLKTKIRIRRVATPPPVDFVLSRDFSADSNPNGVWMFGAKASFGGDLVAFGIRGLNPFQYWQLVPGQEPTIYRNGTPDTITIAEGQGVFPPGTTFLYSGTDGASNGFGVVRFTAPASTNYVVETSTRPVYDGGLQGDTDYHVVKNGAELFGRFLAPADGTSFSNVVTLAAGDVLDFMVGRGSDGSGVASGLKLEVSITPSAETPPPSGFVMNGSFELGVNPGISADVSGPDSTSITGWTVQSASVDYIGSRWIAADGVRCLDLSGTDAATISQTISGLTPGEKYRLSFSMAANPEVGQFAARLRASIAGASEEFEFVQSGFSASDLGWEEKSLEFVATAASHELSFASLNPGWAGAALDDVGIALVPSPAPFVANGSFELGIDPGISTDVSGPNSTSITGWTVESANVDYIGSRWTAGDGVRCLDLSGTDAGTISQMIAGLTPGQAYRLSFLMAANPEVATYTAQLRATIGDVSSEFTFSQPGITTANLGWTEKTLDFVASATTHKLSFISLNPGWAGAALDKVAIVAAPLPPPPAMLIANGSFELGVNPGTSADVSGPDSTTITGWTVENASVDYIGTRWVAADGVRCLDLSGTDAATISQMVEGLAPGQYYRLSFSMAANPEVAPFAARLRASIGGTSEEFSFGPQNGSVSNLGWVQKSLGFTATATTLKLSFQSLNRGWAGAALDKISIVASTNPPPPNHAPLAKIEIEPPYNVWPDQTNLMAIAVNGLEADLILDGSLSSDEDGDVLAFAWTRNDEGATFALGVLTTNTFEVGFHDVTLVVDDGKITGSATVNLEVLTLEDAVDELYGVLVESEIPRKDKRPLLTTLGRVWDSFNDGRLNSGAKQLRAFQQKARAQLDGNNADAGRRMVHVAQQIIDAINDYLVDHEEPWRDGKEKEGRQ